jgi:hypothetical protein
MLEPAHAHHHRAAERADGYQRRRPEESELYQTVAEHWPSFRERAEEVGGLPKFVVAEMEEYLDCGVLERGCLRLACRACGHSEVVAFSCKRRGFCPSCLGRRMADTAVHLESRVLPAVPIRHWVCTLPWGLRALSGYDRRLCAAVMGAFAEEVMRSLRHRAKRALGLSSVADAHAGLVLAVQRTDSALRLNVHAHALALDGVYVQGEQSGSLVFHALPTPTRDEVAEVARRTAERVDAILRAQDRSLDPAVPQSDPHPLELEESGLAACYAAAAQGALALGTPSHCAPLRLVGSQVRTDAPAAEVPAAEVRGINVHARQVVDGRDRRQLERLCRYITRPPLAQDRLARRTDGTLELTLKSPWRDGTRAVVMSPHDFLARLVAAVPPPRFHLLRYFGVMSSHSKHRADVVPTHAADPDAHVAPPAEGDQLPLFGNEPPRRGRHRWAWLLRHVFAADLETCTRCGGPMRWLEAATTTADIARILAALGLAPRPPPRPPAPSPLGQLSLRFR